MVFSFGNLISKLRKEDTLLPEAVVLSCRPAIFLKKGSRTPDIIN